MPSKSRYVLFVAVAGTHAIVLSVFIGRSRIIGVPSAHSKPIAALIVLSPARRRLPVTRPSLGRSPAPIVPIVRPITLAPPAAPVTAPGGLAIDWSAAARQAAAAILERRKRLSFGFPPGGKSAITLGVPSPSSPAHHAGESDRTVSGEHIEWTSDRCYVASDPPLPGEPDILKHARVSRGGCLPPPGPDPGELFKRLPAYRKYHPQ